MTSRHYYAAQAPRGFANEIDVHRFCSAAERDAWVDEHRSDGDCNAATMGAYSVTAREALSILRRRGDDATEQYNRMICHERAER